MSGIVINNNNKSVPNIDISVEYHGVKKSDLQIKADANGKFKVKLIMNNAISINDPNVYTWISPSNWKYPYTLGYLRIYVVNSDGKLGKMLYEEQIYHQITPEHL